MQPIKSGSTQRGTASSYASRMEEEEGDKWEENE